MSLDPKKQQAIHERALADLGGALTALLVHMGDKLGLYKAMSGVGFLSSADLAGRTGTRERYVREWLNNQAAAGYVEYDAVLRKYRLSDEAAQVLAREDSPSMLAGAFEAVAGLAVDEPKLTAAFRSGAGVPWGDHDPRLFSGLERFLRPEYAANLMSSMSDSSPEQAPSN